MFKKLKSLFVIEDENASLEAKSSPAENTTTSKIESTLVHKAPVVTPVAGVDGQVQDKFLQVLFDALQANNQEGFDYLEFKDFLRSLANVPMDDNTRFKSAFATAQTMGATKDKLLSSAKQYIAILGNEDAKFKEALSGQKDRNLTGKQDDIKNLEKTIQDNETEMEKLKAENEDHRKQITTLEHDINAASEKLSQTANDFGATYQALLTQIEDDVKNIESHL
ncbi:MAG: hypothetical protein ABJC12_13690 [Saprospiraceae bacterium]